MEHKEFKTLFDRVALGNEFTKAFGAYFMESEECIIVLDLQKSKYGTSYSLLIKIYIHGAFGKTYVKGKQLVTDTGDVFRGEPVEFKEFFNLENAMDDEKRILGLETLFTAFVVPFTRGALSKKGLLELAKQNEIFILPAVQQTLKLE